MVMARTRTWSDEQLSFIRDNYLTMTRPEMSKQLSVPKSVVSRKMKEMGLKKLQPDPAVGHRFDRLVITSKYIKRYAGQSKTVAVCLCDCGKTIEKWLSTLKHSKTPSSCGCLKSENVSRAAKKRNFKHGRSDLKNNKLYRAWAAMKSRCYNKNVPTFKHYGGRGIKVCDEWRQDYMAFEKWSMSNGFSVDLSIDRRDNNGDYTPENCRWATVSQQVDNRSVTIHLTAFGETKCLSDWMRDTRCKAGASNTICYRIGAGWSPEKAITTPPKNK